MISIKNLSYAFGKRVVFDRISVNLPDNGIVALTGSNGIGKTTLLRILGGVYKSGFFIPYDGWAFYIDIEFLTLDMLTVAELLQLLGKQEGKFNPDVLNNSDLIDETMRSTMIQKLSLGQRQRVVLTIAAAFVNSCVVLLDEPFNGLDHQACEVAHKMIEQLAQTRLVVLATHHVSDIQRYAHYILHIDGPSGVTLSHS